MATETDIQQTPFVKQLAANDRPTRDAALASLRTYLSGRRDLPPLELLKLWKGLFYCMWMCDRPLPQQQLAQALADLVHVLPTTSKSSKASGAHGQESKIKWLQAFWQTMGREWTGIDVLRMEKFLLLVRRVLCSGFEMCKRAEWDGEVVRAMVDVLSQGPLEPRDQRVPNGMRYHAIDIYVDELERVGVLGGEGDKGEEEEADKELVERLLEPLRAISKESPTKTVRIKAKEALGDERLPGNRKTEEEITAAAEEKRKREEEEGWGGIED